MAAVHIPQRGVHRAGHPAAGNGAGRNERLLPAGAAADRGHALQGTQPLIMQTTLILNRDRAAADRGHALQGTPWHADDIILVRDRATADRGHAVHGCSSSLASLACRQHRLDGDSAVAIAS